MATAYTIGYEATDIDRFIRTLQAVGVTLLVDVRAVAISRKRGFSKTALSQRLQSEGIQYTHLAGLGDPKPGREAARAGRHSEFVKIYSDHLKLKSSKDALVELAGLADSDAVCLLCFERDPQFC